LHAITALGLSFVFAAVGGGLVVPEAGAHRSWCRSDPVLKFERDLADVLVSAPVDAPLRVTGPNRIVVTVSMGVDTDLILEGPGFGKGENVTIARSNRLRVTDQGIELHVKVYVPAAGDQMPVRLEFAPRVVGLLSPASAAGRSNEGVVLRTRL
jgi:hypothetical protein